MEMILGYFEKFKLKKLKILEIGFGGGQLAYQIIKKEYIMKVLMSQKV